MTELPRLLIAAPATGSGKTTLALGLIAALRSRGLRVAPNKVGPDYIDAGYLALAAGRPSRTLDPVLLGEDLVGPLLLHGAREADVAVVEGVMGLFDGRLGTVGMGSSAHVAELTATPVVLVVDASRASRSVAATVLGFATFDPATSLAGVVLNGVASVGHEQELCAAIAGVGVPVLGVLARRPAVDLPSRHLGLVTATEHGSAIDVIDRLGVLVEESVDVDRVLDLARQASALSGAAWSPGVAAGSAPGRASGAGPCVAVCSGPAFSFRYPELGELLVATGARVVDVDPTVDDALPDGTGALVVPGGFPEQHAPALASNVGFRQDVARLAREGAPILAECGGLLYLARSLDGHPMCGVVPADAAMTSRLTLGYRDAVAVTSGTLVEAGERVTGHEFHRTALTPRAGSSPAWSWSVGGEAPVVEGYVVDGLHASYLHVHPAARPAVAARLVAAA